MAMRPARVKGKGADIFFEHADEPETEVGAPQNQQADEAAGQEVGEPERQDEGKPLSQQDGKTAEQQEAEPDVQHDAAAQEGRVGDDGGVGYSKATFYFRPYQLEDLEDVRHALRRQHGIKADKSQIMRAALDAVVEDFQEKQEEGVLARMLRGT